MASNRPVISVDFLGLKVPSPEDEFGSPVLRCEVPERFCCTEVRCIDLRHKFNDLFLDAQDIYLLHPRWSNDDFTLQIIYDSYAKSHYDITYWQDAFNTVGIRQDQANRVWDFIDDYIGDPKDWIKISLAQGRRIGEVVDFAFGELQEELWVNVLNQLLDEEREALNAYVQEAHAQAKQKLPLVKDALLYEEKIKDARLISNEFHNTCCQCGGYEQ